MKLLSLLLFVGSYAASQSAQQQPSLQHRTQAPAYVLGPGDLLVIHVGDLDEIPDKPIRIDPNGFIDLPLAGRVHVAGLTVQELKLDLASRLNKFVDTPEVTVNLTESESRPVSVIGSVNNPGVRQLAGSKRLIEVISLSGGIKPDAGPDVIVTREPKWGKIDAPGAKIDASTGYSTATFSVDALLASKDPANNIVIEPDDIVSVPRADLVYVVGNVHKAGGFQIASHRTISLLQVISLAEGLGSDNAASRARILRPAPGGDGTPREIPVDVNKIFAGKAPDVPMYANDVLFIPNSGSKVVARRAMEAALGVTTGLLIYRH